MTTQDHNATHTDACDLDTPTQTGPTANETGQPASHYAPNKYVIRLCSIVINSALTRFCRDVDNIQRGLAGKTRTSPQDIFRDARQEGDFIIRNIDTIVQQHGKESDLGDTLKKLHQYQLVLKSIKLESPRCSDNLLALRETFIRSVTDIDHIINDLTTTPETPEADRPVVNVAAQPMTSPPSSAHDNSEETPISYTSQGLLAT